MVPQKVQIEESDASFIEMACRLLNYRSKSQYIRTAIKEKIRADRARLRELKRQQAMQAYADQLDNVFASLEGEDFADR
jgi:Arc/MetJ-type ribon-helix-helix transcriptional regulator